MVKCTVSLVIMLSFLLVSCSTNNIQAPVFNHNNTIKRTATSYVVRRGDTLYSIAWQVGKDYQTLARWNAIARPYTIFVGQTIKFYPNKTPINHKIIKKINNKTKLNQRIASVTSNKYKKALKLKWQWPIKVRQLENERSHTGVTVIGKLHELVRSGESGKVVYAGSGLKGYGNLLIIKHNEEFLSAYGFNKRLLVEEGVFVKKGQAIAEIGLDSKKRPVLFFEIRRKGKPISVTRYLPKLKRG